MPESADPVPPGSGPAGEATAGAGRFTNIVRLASVDSTNRVAAEAATAGAREGLVVVAAEQLAGRGRRGRSWLAPAGSSLLASILLRPPLAPEDAHLAAACVALAARQALSDLAALVAGLKWPNDLVVPADLGRPERGARKLAGVLAEWVQEGAIVVGVGVNLCWPAGQALPEGATTLAAASGVEIHPAELLAPLLAALEDRYAPLAAGLAGAGGRIAGERRLASATIGERVRVEQADGSSVVGLAIDVADDGRLIVSTDGGAEIRLGEGDVVHLRPASAGGPAPGA